MASKNAAVIARIISEYSDKGSKVAAKDIDKLGKQFHDFGSKVAKTFAVAAAASAAFAIKLGVDSVKAAMAEEQSIAILANTLKNVTGATNDQIDAVDSYIKQTMLRLNVQDDLLRPSLQALVIATHDITKAEGLQQVALDVSANRGKDLTAVSIALAKAYAGNFNALKRLGIPLSETLIKSKDFVGIVKELEAATKGSAAAAADTFSAKVERIGLAFDEVKKTIGNAIILALQPFLDKFTKFLPKIEKWLDDNAKKIAAFFITGISYGVAFAQVLYDVFSFVIRNIKTFETLGAVIAAAFIGAKVASGVSALIEGILVLIKVYKGLAAAETLAAAGSALITGGISAAAGAAAFAASLIAIKLAMDKFNKESNKASDNMGALKFDFKGLSLTTADYLKGLNNTATGTGKVTSTTDKLTAAQKQLLAIQKQLAAKGTVATTEANPIELEAVRLNLVKQHNVELDAAYARLMANYEAQMFNNTAAQRYADILDVIADKDISVNEVNLLSKKWGESQASVIAYIGSVLGADSYSKTLTSPGDITAMGWRNALGDLDNYIATLKTVPKFDPNTGVSPAIQQAVTEADTASKAVDAAIAAADAATAMAEAASKAADDLIASLGLNNPKTDIGGNVIGSAVPNFTPYNGYSVPSSSTANFGVSNASTASTGATGGGGITIINNIAGSAVTTSDLTAIVKDNLLQGQVSGKAVSFNNQVF